MPNRTTSRASLPRRRWDREEAPQHQGPTPPRAVDRRRESEETHHAYHRRKSPVRLRPDPRGRGHQAELREREHGHRGRDPRGPHPARPREDAGHEPRREGARGLPRHVRVRHRGTEFERFPVHRASSAHAFPPQEVDHAPVLRGPSGPEGHAGRRGREEAHHGQDPGRRAHREECPTQPRVLTGRRVHERSGNHTASRRHAGAEDRFVFEAEGSVAVMSGPHGTLAERFWTKVDLSDLRGCWLWLGAISSSGYGSMRHAGKAISAHVVAWETWNQRKVPAGLYLDHYRMNPGPRSAPCSKRCVNPRHLEPVSRRENVQRGRAGILNNAQRAKTR